MKTIAITGVLGYSGRYIAAEAVRRGYRVIGLTNSADRLPNPQGYELRRLPWSSEENVLEGTDALINTYWVRFSYDGKGHAAFNHTTAVENTKKLFAAAQAAGVKRIVHTSITKPDSQSELSYFRGKAELESALEATGIPHSILRPAVLFGETPAESILLNNMAWTLRHLPAAATFGMGRYRLQPIHVQDFAELAMNEAAGSAPHTVINATGAETYSFRELWRLLARAMGVYRPILPVPAPFGLLTARLLGSLVGDVMLTRDEIAGLSQDRLATDTPPAGQRKLSEWVQTYAEELGRNYASELARRQ